MHAAGGDAHQDVAHLDLRAVDELALLHHARREAGDVVFVALVHTGHLGGLAAHERATRLAAAFGHAGDDGLDLGRDVVAQGHVVEEEEGLGALREHIVDAHGHGVDADGVVLVHRERDLELGAHAVGAAHQDRLLVAERSEVEHTAERADAAHGARAGGGGDVLLDAADHFVARFQVHACFFVRLCHIVSLIVFYQIIIQEGRVLAREARLAGIRTAEAGVARGLRA